MIPQPNKDIRKCPVCGHDVIVTIGKRGRPAVYHPDCKRLASVMSWAEDLIIGIDFTPEQSRKMRGELWRLSNCLNKMKGSKHD